MFLLVLLFIASAPLYGQRPLPTDKATAFAYRYEAPYLIDFGAYTPIGGVSFYAPYIGVGILPTSTSISWFAYAGMQVRKGIFAWDIGYFHAFIPDLQFLSYDNLENYAKTDFSWNLEYLLVRYQVLVGNVFILTNGDMRQADNLTAVRPALRQNIRLGAWLKKNEFLQSSLVAETGTEHIFAENQHSWFLRLSAPLTLNFGFGKLGFLAAFYYTAYLPGSDTYQIGRRFLGYDKTARITKPGYESLYHNFYTLTGVLSAAYRFYFFTAPKPHNTFYFALGSDVGFGVLRNGISHFHVIGSVAFGYEYKDSSPFEIRFGIDQDRNIYFHFNVVSPIRHRL